MIGLSHFLIVAGLLFAAGVYTVLSRSNAIGILMGVELILNAAGLNFVAFNHFTTAGVEGSLFTVFIIVLAAAEAAVALAIVLAIYQNRRDIDASRMDTLQH
jgi:NADH-quinone oxidoreductase subunit K